MKKVLLIIPVYNEAENIRKVMDTIDHHVSVSGFDYIIINDGSSDHTIDICKRENYHYVDLPINLGLAGAFQTGLKYALYNGYDYAIQIDGDGQHDPKYIKPMLCMAEEEGYDIVIGSRFVNEKRKKSLRMLGNTLLEFLIRVTTGKSVSDPTSGMRLYNSKMIKILANSVNNEPEPDTVAFLMRSGAKVGECQVHMNEREAGESYLNFTRSIKYMWHMCVSILIVQWFRKKV